MTRRGRAKAGLPWHSCPGVPAGSLQVIIQGPRIVHVGCHLAFGVLRLATRQGWCTRQSPVNEIQYNEMSILMVQMRSVIVDDERLDGPGSSYGRILLGRGHDDSRVAGSARRLWLHARCELGQLWPDAGLSLWRRL